MSKGAGGRISQLYSVWLWACLTAFLSLHFFRHRWKIWTATSQGWCENETEQWMWKAYGGGVDPQQLLYIHVCRVECRALLCKVRMMLSWSKIRFKPIINEPFHHFSSPIILLKERASTYKSLLERIADMISIFPEPCPNTHLLNINIQSLLQRLISGNLKHSAKRMEQILFPPSPCTCRNWGTKVRHRCDQLWVVQLTASGPESFTKYPKTSQRNGK